MLYDYLVIAGYFLLIVAIGFVFTTMAKTSTSDYFRGGGRMLWWMVGSTAFMAQFSAWTFTGAAGKAYTDGFAVSLVFFANTVAYFCGWAYFSHRFRQMRVMCELVIPHKKGRLGVGCVSILHAMEFKRGHNFADHRSDF